MTLNLTNQIDTISNPFTVTFSHYIPFSGSRSRFRVQADRVTCDTDINYALFHLQLQRRPRETVQMSILIGGNKVKRISGKTSHLDWLTIIDSSIRSKIITIGRVTAIRDRFY